VFVRMRDAEPASSYVSGFGRPSAFEPSAQGARVAESNFGDVIKRQSLPTLLGAIALVLVVGLGAGFGIGYKVEQSRTKSDLKKAREAAAAKAAKKPAAAATAAVRLIGKVDATTANNVSITVGKTSRKVAIRPATTYVKAVAGSA